MDKGLETLFSFFSLDKAISQQDIDLAKRQGYMFDYSPPLPHDEALIKLRETVSKISPEMVSNAFLFSLSTRRLEYRSALGSYWYAVAIPAHESTDSRHCCCCGWSLGGDAQEPSDVSHRLNTFNYERYKWGGVRHTTADYALFDLRQFLQLPEPKHTPEDEKLLRDILNCISELEGHNKAGALQKLITKKQIIKSSRYEIDTLLDILGICGVLSSDDAPCYAQKFCGEYERSPLENTNDRAYPLNRWRASDGVSKERLKIVFGME